jgi:hypothetical protein
VNARSSLETIGLAILCLAVGWFWKGASVRAEVAEAANASLAKNGAAIQSAATNAAATAEALSRIDARTATISTGLKQNAQAIQSLSGCIIPFELGRVFQLRQETINAASEGSSKADILPSRRRN